MTDAHRATLSFSYDDPASACAVERCLAPEVGAIDDDRSRATVDRADATLAVRIDAADLVALRAACNTWSRLVTVAEDVAAG